VRAKTISSDRTPPGPDRRYSFSKYSRERRPPALHECALPSHRRCQPPQHLTRRQLRADCPFQSTPRRSQSLPLPPEITLANFQLDGPKTRPAVCLFTAAFVPRPAVVVKATFSGAFFFAGFLCRFRLDGSLSRDRLLHFGGDGGLRLRLLFLRLCLFLRGLNGSLALAEHRLGIWICLQLMIRVELLILTD
jgi:hypothetical protein